MNQLDDISLICKGDDIDEDDSMRQVCLLEEMFSLAVKIILFSYRKMGHDEVAREARMTINNLCLLNEEAGRLFYLDVKAVELEVLERVKVIQKGVFRD
ncbi:MAG: hypothetical protein GY820_39040 [Gammaproteobacteria bacterium]|nr:hypothetical protein [Gammaproteobacteria bacterium]